jgi:hypothetical protein
MSPANWNAHRWAARILFRALALTALAMPLAAVAYANDADSASVELLPPVETQPIESQQTESTSFAILDEYPTGPELPAELLPLPDAAPPELDPNSIPAAVPLDADIPLEDGPIVSLTDDPSLVDAEAAAAVPPNELFYNPGFSSTNWIIGKNDRFGMVSLDSSMSLRSQEMDGVVGGFDVHFLDGPIENEMPPRLFDFVIGYGRRRWITPNLGYDVLARVGVYTDFEGSARKGVRFPGHAVLQLRMTPERDWLFGVEVLDRDDISLLPVIGPRWRPNGDWELDLVFPRPRIAVRLPQENHWAYIRGELGGGTWAIERDESIDDNATYRDLRLIGGYEFRHGEHCTALEIAYVFARDLSYRSGIDMPLEDAVMIGLTGRY